MTEAAIYDAVRTPIGRYGGEIHLAIAGGVESRSRAPIVIGKAEGTFACTAKLEDTRPT